MLLQVPGVAAAVVDTFEPTPGAVGAGGLLQPAHAGSRELDPEDITAHLRERLPSYMVPAYLEQLAAIPMTTSDKADRKALPAPTRAAPDRAAASTSPRPARPSRLLADALAAHARRWTEVSVESDFFDDLGANSLLMAQFSARVRKTSGLPSLSMREIYQHPTVRALARRCWTGRAPASRAAERHRTGTVVRTSTARLRADAGRCSCWPSWCTAYLVGAPARPRLHLGRTPATTPLEVRSPARRLTVAVFLAACLLPILAKWVLIGRWKAREIRLWSLRLLPVLAGQDADRGQPAGAVRRLAALPRSTCARSARRSAAAPRSCPRTVPVGHRPDHHRRRHGHPPGRARSAATTPTGRDAGPGGSPSAATCSSARRPCSTSARRSVTARSSATARRCTPASSSRPASAGTASGRADHDRLPGARGRAERHAAAVRLRRGAAAGRAGRGAARRRRRGARRRLSRWCRTSSIPPSPSLASPRFYLSMAAISAILFFGVRAARAGRHDRRAAPAQPVGPPGQDLPALRVPPPRRLRRSSR